MALSCRNLRDRRALRQQTLCDLDRRQRREESRDLHVKDVRRAAHERRPVARNRTDDELLAALAAKCQVRRALLLQERRIEAVPARKECLRSSEDAGRSEGGPEVLQGA